MALEDQIDDQGSKRHARMSKQELAYNEIRQRILTGAYAPGDHIVVDALAQELQFSAVPIREAIRRLEAEGWIVYARHLGARVAPTDEHAWEEMLGALAILEGAATAAGVVRLSTNQRKKLWDLHNEMQSAAEKLDVFRFSRLNREFHQVMYEQCDNSRILAMIAELRERMDFLRRTTFALVPARMHESTQEHRELLDAIGRDAPPSEIESLARAHKLRTLASYRAAWADSNRQLNGVDGQSRLTGWSGDAPGESHA